MFNPDQVDILLGRDSHGAKWTDATIMKALQVHVVCGRKGYRLLLKQGLPYPSERTLNRKLCSLTFTPEMINSIAASATSTFKSEETNLTETSGAKRPKLDANAKEELAVGLETGPDVPLVRGHNAFTYSRNSVPQSTRKEQGSKAITELTSGHSGYHEDFADSENKNAVISMGPIDGSNCDECTISSEQQEQLFLNSP